jgi:hypothetical protein
MMQASTADKHCQHRPPTQLVTQLMQTPQLYSGSTVRTTLRRCPFIHYRARYRSRAPKSGVTNSHAPWTTTQQGCLMWVTTQIACKASGQRRPTPACKAAHASTAAVAHSDGHHPLTAVLSLKVLRCLVWHLWPIMCTAPSIMLGKPVLSC